MTKGPAITRAPNAAWEILPSLAFTAGWLAFVLTAVRMGLPSSGVYRERQLGFALYHWTFFAVLMGFAYLIIRGMTRRRVPLAPLRIDLPVSFAAGILTYLLQALLFCVAGMVMTIDMATMGLLTLVAVGVVALIVGKIGSKCERPGT